MISQSRHIPLVVKDFLWPHIKYKLEYKVILFNLKALNGLAPPYLTDLLHPYLPSHAQRSQNHNPALHSMLDLRTVVFAHSDAELCGMSCQSTCGTYHQSLSLKIT